MNPLLWSEYYLEVPRAQRVDGIGGGRQGVSVSGLQMQTVFRNPLAGPSVLGDQFRCQPGCGLCGITVRGRMGGVALSRLGSMGEVALSVAPLSVRWL